MFVTASDFDVKPYNLLGLDETVEDGELTTFELFVEEQEEKVLVKLLGRYFYDKLAAGMEALPEAWSEDTAYAIDDEATFDNKVWKALTANTGIEPVEGADWTVVEASNRWLDIRDGVEFTGSDQRRYKWDGMKAAIKPLIYSEWLASDLGQVSTSGLVNRAATENGTTVLPDREIIKGFNEYSERVAGVYPQYIEYDTLYGLLYNNKTLYNADTTDAGYNTFFEYLTDRFEAPGFKNVFNL